jgi:3-hydroxyisobutyrate dehydrogenase
MGISPVTSIKAASQDVDYIVCSLPKTDVVEGVLRQDGGIFENASEGTCIVDTSTISPIAAKEFSSDAIKHKMSYIDAPMSGGVMGALNGTLTFMVGAPTEEDYEKAKVVLAGMGKKFFHCGGPGTGEIAKLSNNLILGIQMIAASEGMVLGEKLGIDPKVLCDILSVSTGNCWAVSACNPRPGILPDSPASKNYEGGFQTALMRKDLALALSCAEEVGAQTKFAEEAVDYYAHLEKKGHGGKDFGYVFQYIMKDFKV